MQVTFYTTKSDNMSLTKNLEDEVQKSNVTGKGLIDMLHPVLVLQYDSRITNSNYAYIPEFKRYYFINRVQVTIGSQMVVTLDVDPLMSFNSQLKSLECVVIRSSGRNLMITDRAYIPKAVVQSYVFPFSEQFDAGLNGKYVLQVAGGR